MYSNTKISTSTKNYWDKIKEAQKLIQNAERIILGIGSGLSAAGGLSYGDPELFQRWFPEYVEMGYKTIIEAQRRFWWLRNSQPEHYWGYWAKHIYHIRYETECLPPYQQVFDMLKDRDYFIITTNGDGQVQKADFPEERVFAMQGNYEYFQCIKPCTHDIYQNREMLDRMLENMVSPIEIRTEDVPKCPRCGEFLVPNLRIDDTFVQEPHMKMQPAYRKFITDSEHKETLFLELGVGYNTPGIIRFPFESLTHEMDKAHLIRVNMSEANVPWEIRDKSVSFQDDLGKVVGDFLID